jgi:HSP20 family molecular chaperone IbpA
MSKKTAKKEKVEKAAKFVVPVVMTACLDDKGENYLVEIEIPGASKESIDLKMLDDIVQVKAERKDSLYLGHLHFPLRVDPKKADAEFNEGLLTVKVPVVEKREPPTTITIK